VLGALPKRSLSVPLDCLVEIMPRLQPRYYTISSSSECHPHRIHATVSIVRDPSADGREIQGVCSCYMDHLAIPAGPDKAAKKAKTGPCHPGEQGAKQPRAWPTAAIFVRPSTFTLPEDPAVPVIMVGPGTGVAPMRAFLQERQRQKQAGRTVGEAVLFFGCRDAGKDFIYEDEFLAYAADGTLTALHTAFSRMQEKKIYVQDRVREHGAELWALLQVRPLTTHPTHPTSPVNSLALSCVNHQCLPGCRTRRRTCMCAAAALWALTSWWRCRTWRRRKRRWTPTRLRRTSSNCRRTGATSRSCGAKRRARPSRASVNAHITQCEGCTLGV
jgi:hypothetical protein